MPSMARRPLARQPHRAAVALAARWSSSASKHRRADADTRLHVCDTEALHHGQTRLGDDECACSLPLCSRSPASAGLRRRPEASDRRRLQVGGAGAGAGVREEDRPQGDDRERHGGRAGAARRRRRVFRRGGDAARRHGRRCSAASWSRAAPSRWRASASASRSSRARPCPTSPRSTPGSRACSRRAPSPTPTRRRAARPAPISPTCSRRWASPPS